MMRRAATAIVVLCVIGAAVAAHKPPDPDRIDQKPGRVEVDWSAGVIRAVGAGAADIRAPNAEIARVGATRQARKNAVAKLLAAARDLPLADGTMTGARLDKDAAARARLVAAAERVRDVSARYSSDGSVELTCALPLEAVRLALAPSADVPVATAGAPTAILVDAEALKLHERLDLTLAAGDERWSGPTLWYSFLLSQNLEDPRLGDRVISCTATKLDGGVVVLDLPAADLAAARKNGALVIVIS